MTLPAFLAVWLATWALCWFGLARVWKSRRESVSVIGLGPDPYVFRGVRGRQERLPNGDVRQMWHREWWRLSGAREWAPLIATVVAFAVDGILALVG